MIILIILWSVIPTFTTSSFQSNYLCWFVTLYAIAGYIRLYGFNKRFTSKSYFKLCGIFVILTYLLSVVFIFLGMKWEFFLRNTTYFYEMEKIPIVLISVTLFMAFKTLKMSYHKVLNKIASATFGVYLIHDNFIVRPILWIDLFKNFQYQNSLIIIPYSILAVVIVYIMCTIIDLIRQKIFVKPYMNIVNRLVDIEIRPITNTYQVLKTIVFGRF